MLRTYTDLRDTPDDTAPSPRGQPPGRGHSSDQTAPLATGASIEPAPAPRHSAISIGIVDGHAFTRECVVRSLRELDDAYLPLPFSGSEEYLRDGEGCDLVLYHLHRSLNEDRLLPEVLKAAPVIILSPTEDPEWVSEALREGARGYVPTTSTSFNLTIEIIRLVLAGGTFVPPSSLSTRPADSLRGSGAKIGRSHFTARELAVLGHLKLGSPNKIIAHQLNLSESTVKVHIRNIMKKMNATNRTEVACRAHYMTGVPSEA